ncbi:MAG: hypothetical protein ACRDPJ_04575 [Nocardioidaceae bacterium]
MRTTKSSRIASVAAIGGAAAWFARGLLVRGEAAPDTAGLPGILLLVGMVALSLAVAGSGYALVATAPVWLRGVVSIAFTTLVWMVWQLVVAALDSEWLSTMSGAAVAFVCGVWGLSRGRPTPPEHTHVRGGRRAAR